METYEIVDFGFDTEYGLIKDFLDYLQGNQQMSLVEQFLNNRKQKSKLNEKSSLVKKFLYEQKKDKNDNDNQVEKLQSLYDEFVNTKDLTNNEFSVSDFIEFREKKQKLFGMIIHHLTKIRINDINKKAIKRIIDKMLDNESFIDSLKNQDKQIFDMMKDILEKIK